MLLRAAPRFHHMITMSPAQYVVTMVDEIYSSFLAATSHNKRIGACINLKTEPCHVKSQSCEEPGYLVTGSIGMVISASCAL